LDARVLNKIIKEAILNYAYIKLVGATPYAALSHKILKLCCIFIPLHRFLAFLISFCKGPSDLHEPLAVVSLKQSATELTYTLYMKLTM